MIILGLILLILGLVFGIHLLFVLGIILVLVGVVLMFARPGGRYYF